MSRQIKRFWRDDRIAYRRALVSLHLPYFDNRIQRLLTLRHGLETGIDSTLEEVGSELGLTRERIRQLEDDALYQLEQSGVNVSRMRWPFPTVRPKRGISEAEAEKRKRARILMSHAIRRGELIREPCEICGKKADGHHDNYDKPLEVRWLCPKHHRAAHGKRAGRATIKPARKDWIAELPPPHDASYPVKRIRSLLLVGRPDQRRLARAIGISVSSLVGVLCGAKTYSHVLLKVLNYVEKQKESAKAA
jgi:hypothetical protein